MTICAQRPGSTPTTFQPEISLRVERILADGPCREECQSTAQYERLRRMHAWAQALRESPKLACPFSSVP